MQENGDACITECAQGEIQCLHKNNFELPLICIPKEEVAEKRCNGVNDCDTVGANDELQENGEACVIEVVGNTLSLVGETKNRKVRIDDKFNPGALNSPFLWKLVGQETSGMNGKKYIFE